MFDGVSFEIFLDFCEGDRHEVLTILERETGLVFRFGEYGELLSEPSDICSSSVEEKQRKVARVLKSLGYRGTVYVSSESSDPREMAEVEGTPLAF